MCIKIIPKLLKNIPQTQHCLHYLCHHLLIHPNRLFHICLWLKTEKLSLKSILKPTLLEFLFFTPLFVVACIVLVDSQWDFFLAQIQLKLFAHLCIEPKDLKSLKNKKILVSNLHTRTSSLRTFLFSCLTDHICLFMNHFEFGLPRFWVQFRLDRSAIYSLIWN